MRSWIALASIAIGALLLGSCDDSLQNRYDLTKPAVLRRWDLRFVHPLAIEVGADGSRLVAAYDNIYTFSPSGGLVGSWGAPPGDPLASHFAADLSVGPGGEVFVIGIEAVRVFAADGSFRRAWPPAPTSHYARIAVSSDGTVFIPHFEGIGEYSSQGELRSLVQVAAHDSAVSQASDVAVATNGDLLAIVYHHYETLPQVETIDRYAPDGRLLLRRELSTYAARLDVGPDGTVYACGGKTILGLSAALEIVSRWELSSPSSLAAIATAEDGTVLVLDQFGASVRELDREGTVVRAWTALPPEAAYAPPVVALDREGTPYLLDSYLGRVTRLGVEGEPAASWGQWGSGPGEFLFPNDITVDADGFVYVADAGNLRIQKFSRDGTWVGMWPDPRPFWLASGGWTIYVTDGSSVRRYSPDGDLRGSLRASAGGPYAGIAVDAAGGIYLLDRRRSLVDVYDEAGSRVRSADVRGGNVIGTLRTLALDGRGWIYVVGDATIRVVSAGGSELGSWDFSGAWGLDVDAAGRVAVSGLPSVLLYAPFGQVEPTAGPVAP